MPHVILFQNDYDPNNSSLFLFPVTHSEIIKVASRCLKQNKAAGYDQFKPFIISKVIHLLAYPLTHIFNISLSSGIFPNRMKLAKVIPVYKKGDPKMCCIITDQYRKNPSIGGWKKLKIFLSFS